MEGLLSSETRIIFCCDLHFAVYCTVNLSISQYNLQYIQYISQYIQYISQYIVQYILQYIWQYNLQYNLQYISQYNLQYIHYILQDTALSGFSRGSTLRVRTASLPAPLRARCAEPSSSDDDAMLLFLSR